MVYVEDGRNIPTVVGPDNVPPAPSWGAGRLIADLPSVANLAGHDRSFLPQILRKRPLLTMLQRRPLLTQFNSMWPRGRDVGRLPSVVSILSGPGMPMHPSETPTRGFKKDLYVEI